MVGLMDSEKPMIAGFPPKIYAAAAKKPVVET
jgi:hypothetical protein